jgi:shikimate 5-dehydrogenase
MGFAGRLSRTHYAALGSPFTFVAASSERATAPGQLTLEDALALGMPETASRPFCALVGSGPLSASPGPRVYNRLFRTLGRRMSYVTVSTEDLLRAMPLLERAGAVGLSVTMPHKRSALAIGVPDAVAREVGAANSLRLRGGWESTNTDVAGVAEPLARALEARSATRALVLGAGGAARAASVACKRLGLDVIVCARDVAMARDVAGADGQAVPWDERLTLGPLDDVALIQTTPLTGSASPWPDAVPLDAAIVFDTALGHGESRLLEAARSRGALVLPPLAMWFAQGAAQMSWILDEPIAARMLEEHA